MTRRPALGQLSRKTLEFRLAARRLEPVRRGVHRFAGSPQSPGQALLAAVLAAGPEARRPGYHAGDSDREVHLARVLTDAGLPPPIMQHHVAAGDTVCLLDLACPEARLGVEYDGWDTHRTRSAFDHDRHRANVLALAGWTLLSFTSASGPDQVATITMAAYRRAGRALPPSAVESRHPAEGEPGA